MIYTSYFSKVKALTGQKPNLVFISIAGKTPNWFDNSLIEIHKFKKLSPKKEWWNEWYKKFSVNLNSDKSIKWYSEKYNETVLNKLNVFETKKELMEISENKDIVLLCYETPEKFCHRKIVSEWFNKNEIQCKEI